MNTQINSRLATLDIPGNETSQLAPSSAPSGLMTLGDFKSTWDELSKFDRDVILPRGGVQLGMSEDRSIWMVPGGIDLVQNAIPSLCEKMNVPKSTGEWLRTMHPDHLVEILNTRLGGAPKDKNFIVRLQGGQGVPDQVRFFASEAYKTFDNADMLGAVNASGVGGGVLKAESAIAHARKTGNMSAKLLCGQSEYGYKYGAVLLNSEVGLRGTLVRPFLYRDFCLNGMVFNLKYGYSLITANHRYGINTDILRQEIANVVALAMEGFPLTIEAIESLRDLTYAKVDPVRVIAALANQNKLSTSVFKGWVDAINQEPGESAFHIMQGLTAYARDIEDIDHQTVIETVASTIATGGTMTSDIREVMTRWENYGQMALSTPDSAIEAYLKAI